MGCDASRLESRCPLAQFGGLENSSPGPSRTQGQDPREPKSKALGNSRCWYRPSVLTPLTTPVRRRVESLAMSFISTDPALLLEGPRSVGKSTVLRAVAERTGATILDLDDLAVRDAVNADPATFVASSMPVYIDEYQKAPVVLDAIKAELNRDTRPGRFLLTGSARQDSLPHAAQALTGRLTVVPVLPFSQGELAGQEEAFLPEIFDNSHAVVVHGGVSMTTRDDYIARMVAGGFPMPLRMDGQVARDRWFDNFVRLTLTRDLGELSRVRDDAGLSRLLRRLAGQTAQVLNLTHAAQPLGISSTTARAWTDLMQSLFLLYELPAWGRTLTARSTGRPKVHVIDSGLAARLLAMTAGKLAARQPSAMTELGHLLETFIVGELRKQVSWMDDVATFGHWRTSDDDEVDMVIERNDGRIVAVEVKAAGRVPGSEFRHLRKLRDSYGPAFAAGVVLYLGDRSYGVEDRLFAMPVDRLWTTRHQRT